MKFPRLDLNSQSPAIKNETWGINMKRYSKVEMKAKWKELLFNPDLLYRKGATLFNYIGVLKDEPEMPYIEYISQLMLEDFGILEAIVINLNELRLTKSFEVGHDGTSNATARIQKYGKIRFDEKTFARALYNSGHSFLFGKLFDYEVPLKERISSRYGEIDLLSRIDNEIYVIELKIGYIYRFWENIRNSASCNNGGLYIYKIIEHSKR